MHAHFLTIPFGGRGGSFSARGVSRQRTRQCYAQFQDVFRTLEQKQRKQLCAPKRALFRHLESCCYVVRAKPAASRLSPWYGGHNSNLIEIFSPMAMQSLFLFFLHDGKVPSWQHASTIASLHNKKQSYVFRCLQLRTSTESQASFPSPYRLFPILTVYKNQA